MTNDHPECPVEAGGWGQEDLSLGTREGSQVDSVGKSLCRQGALVQRDLSCPLRIRFQELVPSLHAG